MSSPDPETATSEGDGPTVEAEVEARTFSNYTPPTLTVVPDPATDQPIETDGDAGTATTDTIATATDEATGPTWLDDPVLFWATWLVAVAMGGIVALALGWLLRRRRNEP